MSTVASAVGWASVVAALVVVGVCVFKALREYGRDGALGAMKTLIGGVCVALAIASVGGVAFLAKSFVNEAKDARPLVESEDLELDLGAR